MFSTDEGRTELSSSIDYQRLLVVTLNRAHKYSSVDEVKAELSTKVMELAPPATQERSVRRQNSLHFCITNNVPNILHAYDSKHMS